MESKYNYFKRDISWLSFNYRVLLEALDERLPLYERINFISIYSSNLEEFYKIRVADHSTRWRWDRKEIIFLTSNSCTIIAIRLYLCTKKMQENALKGRQYIPLRAKTCKKQTI